MVELLDQGEVTRTHSHAISIPSEKSSGPPEFRLPTHSPLHRSELVRHDHHNLELKSVFELESDHLVGNFELFLFIPNSVHPRPASKTEMVSDFHSRVRLSIPWNAESEQNELVPEIQRLKELLGSLREKSDPTEFNECLDQILSTSKHLGALVGETLKAKAAHAKREILLAHSLAAHSLEPSVKLMAIARAMDQAFGVNSRIRDLIRSCDPSEIPVLRLLDQYLHHLSVDYLCAVRSELNSILEVADRYPAEKYQDGWKALQQVLDRLQAQEASYFPNRVDARTLVEDQVEQELHLLRSSQLKKFFQSKMFIDVTRREVLKRFSESAAAGGAALAAIWATISQQLSGNAQFTDLSFKGISVICLAVAFYVLKDRLKDHSKAFFAKKLAKVVPDLEQELIAEGKKIGEITEWSGFKKKSSLPADIQVLRASAYLSEAERHLPEDVFHYRRTFELGSGRFNRRKASRWSLQEVLRINVQRYLKHMDDAYKSMRILDADGNLTLLKSHRVYHFYVCVSASIAPRSTWFPLGKKGKPAATGETHRIQRIYRVVMDKNGVDRVEPIASE